MKRTALAAGLGVLLLLAARPAPGQESGPPSPVVGQPDLSGRWVLDPKRSEDPLEKMREGSGKRGGHGSMGGPGGGGEGGRGGGRPPEGERGPGGMGGSGGGPDAGQRARMAERERAAMKLTVTHRDGQLAVQDAIGRNWSLTIGDEEREVPLAEGEPVRARAEWGTGGRLAVRWVRPYGGPVIVETYELVAEGERLLVRVRLEGDDGRPGFEFLRVYSREAEPVKSGEQAP